MSGSGSESDSSSRRWFLYALVAAGGVVLRAGDELAGKTDELIRALREMEPTWLRGIRWSLKLYTGYRVVTGDHLQKQLDLPANGHVDIELDKRVNIQLSYRLSVESGPPVDIMLFDSAEYDKYIEQADATPMDSGSHFLVRSVAERAILPPVDTHFWLSITVRWVKHTLMDRLHGSHSM